MAFSFGFYNSQNHDRRYDALQMSMIFDGIIVDGVYATVGNSLIVKASPEENTVIVSPGRAWFDHTWNYNDADLPITADQSEILLERIDALVLDINADEDVRTNNIIWVKGTPSATPTRPALIKTISHHQYPLCYVHRRANTEVIPQADITNMVGTSECPFVTGVLETIDIDNLLLQWKDEWAQFVVKYEQEAETWTQEQKDDFNAFYNEFKTQMNQFEQSAGREFSDWFAGIQDILDQNTAGNLYNMITAVDQREFDHYYGLVFATTDINDTTGIITTTNSEGVSTTRFQEDSDGNKTITTTIVMNSGSFDYVKTTTITKPSTGTHIETSYVRRPK